MLHYVKWDSNPTSIPKLRCVLQDSNLHPEVLPSCNDALTFILNTQNLVGVLGIEPRLASSKPAVITITLHPNIMVDVERFELPTNSV